MNKKSTLIIVIIILITFVAGIYIYEQSIEKDISTLTTNFDFSNEPETNWNENTKQMEFNQSIKCENNIDYKNISLDVLFYKENNLLKAEKININNTNNGTFNINFITKLSEEPDEFYYNVTKLVK